MNDRQRFLAIAALVAVALLAAASVALAQSDVIRHVTATTVDCGELKADVRSDGSIGVVHCVAAIPPTPISTATAPPPTETPMPTATPPPTVTPEPTVTPGDCNPLIAHDWAPAGDPRLCQIGTDADGNPTYEPPHTHVSLPVGTEGDLSAYACDWVDADGQPAWLPPSAPGATFDDWRTYAGIEDGTDFGLPFATVDEHKKGSGYNAVSVCGLPGAPDLVTIEDVFTIQHRMSMQGSTKQVPNCGAQCTRFHSLFVAIRFSNGAVAYTGRWDETNMLNVSGHGVEMWANDTVCAAGTNPVDNPEACFAAPYEAQDHGDTGTGRLTGMANGVPNPDGIWYKRGASVQPNGVWFGTPTRQFPNGGFPALAPHIITFGIVPSTAAQAPFHWQHDVYGCRDYTSTVLADTSPCAGNIASGAGANQEVGPYFLPVDKRAPAGMTGIIGSDDDGDGFVIPPGNYQVRIDNRVLTFNAGQVTDKDAAVPITVPGQ